MRLIMSNYYFTSESVTEGHPDKLCDTISDNILDEYLKQDKNSRVAVETFASKNLIVVAGEVTSKGNVNVEKVVRDTIKNIGYDNENTDIDYRTCDVKININKQSTDIALGVDIGGAGDQGIMFGYACDETENYMPYAINMAHKLSKRLAEVRKNGTIPYLRPDGKVQVTVEYEDDKPKRIETILISTQHNSDISQEQLKKDIIESVINAVVPENMMDANTKIYVNPTGRFVIGGPLGDTGLTGRKIIVDTYGGYARHGGGAFSGKDASKVDRSGAYKSREMAKEILKQNALEWCQVQLSYAIGIAEPLAIYIESNRGSHIVNKDSKYYEECKPQNIIRDLKLKDICYEKRARYGHFLK